MIMINFNVFIVLQSILHELLKQKKSILSTPPSILTIPAKVGTIDAKGTSDAIATQEFLNDKKQKAATKTAIEIEGMIDEVVTNIVDLASDDEVNNNN